MRLRPYQSEALNLFEKSSKKSMLIVAPTGAGKGTMATELIRRYVSKRRRVVFMVHRREIINDIVSRLEAHSIKAATSIISDRMVRVISVQQAPAAQMQPPDLLILDEAHHYAADVWRGIAENIQAKRVVGFTATPQRADGRPLGDIFDELISVVNYSWLIQKQFLVPCKVLRPPQILENELAQDPVDAYLRYGNNQRALMFVRRIEDARNCRDQLLQHGIPADYVTAQTRKEDRDQALQMLRTGELQIIVNVGTLTEGVDVPEVSCIVLARPCAHASLYVQIAGRALRSAPGKHEATLIDLVGASHIHGLPGEDRAYSLDGAGIAVSRNPDQFVTREPAGEGLPYDVLDLHLEVVTLGMRPKIIPKPPTKPRSSSRAPLTRPPPQPRTKGFIFEDKGFWFLAWSEHGIRKRTGLATKDKEQAETYLKLFRSEGIADVKDLVRRNKRRGATIWRHHADKWRLRTWNEEKTKQVEYKLYTRDEDNARAIRDCFAAGNYREAEALIAKNKKTWGKEVADRQVKAQLQRSESLRKYHAERKMLPAAE